MTTNVAEVAAKLTEAQREALLNWFGQPAYAPRGSNVGYHLAGKGLLDWTYPHMHSDRRKYHLTQDGLKVRQYLKEQETADKEDSSHE